MSTTNGTTYTPNTFKSLLCKLVQDPDSFTLDDVRTSFSHICHPDGSTPSQSGAFLTALKLTGKDQSAEVVAVCADVLRSQAIDVEVGGRKEGEDWKAEPVCDIVGTGGDGHNTFNVSTTAAIVAAGAGCKVFKHGNRAATSSSGSADILVSLDCPVTSIPPSSIPSISSQSPFLFLFAPNYHPAMARLAPIRQTLGFRTVFNILGPLINPARPDVMIVGVHSKSLGSIFATALKLLGIKRAWVVNGAEGLDEISPEGPTFVWELRDGLISQLEISPSSFGVSSNPLQLVRGGTASENAATLVSLLNGELLTSNPIENFVVINTAALLALSGRAKDLLEGVELARKSIQGGGAKMALEAFRKSSQEAAASGKS